MFGYPSKNLLNIHRTEKYFEEKLDNNNNIDKSTTYLSYFLRFSLLIFLAPISISSIIIGNILDLNNSIYKKPLKEPYVGFIKKKIKSIFKKHKKHYQLDFVKVDYNKLLIHHSYNFNLPHQPKLMNYVSLYGFLRVISFNFNLLSVFILLQIIFFSKDKLYINLKGDISGDLIVFLISSFMAYISYLGYLKFYRRYTQENLMILLL